MQLFDEELDAVVALIDPLREFTKYGSRMHRRLIKTLLLVAREEGKSVGEYAALAGVSLAHMSRDLLELGEYHDGLGLVLTRRRRTDNRKKDILLTPEGRELANRMVGYWRNEPEVVREYRERMHRNEDEKKKVIELQSRPSPFKSGSAEWEAFLKGNAKPRYVAHHFGDALRYLMRAVAVQTDYSSALFGAEGSWKFMSELIARCEEPPSWHELFAEAVKGLRDDGGPELSALDEAYREVARTGMSLYIEGKGPGGFASVKDRSFMEALRHLEELRDRERKEREREAALRTPAITWKSQSPQGDEVTFGLAPGAFTVMVMQVSDVRGGKVVKHRPRRTSGCSIAWAKLSQENAIKLAELILTKYTAGKEESVQDCMKPERLNAVLQAGANRAEPDVDHHAQAAQDCGTEGGDATSTGLSGIYGEIKKLIPISSLHAFLLVAQQEGLSVNEYAQNAGVSKSVMSRTLREINDIGHGIKGLVASRRRPMNLRRKEVFLTPKGYETVRRIDEVLVLNLNLVKLICADEAAPPWLKVALSRTQKAT
jgi:DNA-binding MarR family transcriptional regulator